MTLKYLRQLCAAVCLSAVAWVWPAEAAVPLLDDRGRSVAMAQSPQRIVSLLPSLTETVCALGACDRLVGVDRYSNWPGSVQALPKVGGGLDPSLEAIVALKPDLVLLSGAARVAERLDALGLRTVVLEPRSQVDVQRILHVVGAALHISADAGAQRVWREMQLAVIQAVQSLPAGVAGARVYFEVSRGPYAAGPTSFIGELLAQMGMRNIVPANMGPFPRLNPEFVVQTQPQVILVGSQSVQDIGNYPGWHTLRAVREQRVCHFEASASDVLVRPGPRMPEAARLIAQCLRDKAPRRGVHD